MIATNAFLSMDNLSQSPPKPSSPASPTLHFTNQQSMVARSFMNLSHETRGQQPSLATTSYNSQTNLMDPPPGVNYADFMKTWTDHHVARWLTDISCGNQAVVFKDNDIRGDVLLELDQVALKEMGISSIGDRLRILNAVKVLRQRALVRNATPIMNPLTPNIEKLPSEKLSSISDARPTPRREIGRPAPLQLRSNTDRGDLPDIIREQPPDSARPNPSHTIRPLPHPTQSPPVPPANTPNSAHTVIPGPLRPNLPPLPPPPRGQPPLPPLRGPGRSMLNSTNGWATPTQAEAPPYTSQPLPPPPVAQGHLTPPSGGRNNHHLPSDPRPGNPGGKPPLGRATSPLPPTRLRPNTSGTAHGRNGSVGLSPPNSSSPVSKIPPRPSTAATSHPYATAQATLLPPTSHQIHNLSPIEEAFSSQHNSSGSPSPPAQAYTVGRGPFNSSATSHNAPYSLDDLRRKLVKFVLPDDGLSFTIDVATCSGGIEVLEKVLKKFGKGGSRSTDTDGSMDYSRMDGGLSVDGWGVYLDMGQEDGPGEPLTEAELLSICHAPPDHPTREHGLTLRRLRRLDDRSASPSPGQVRSSTPNQTSRSTKRASSISILSGLGVHDPEKALDPPSPTLGRLSPAIQNNKRPSKLRNFFGQRPPSELITNHLTEYFPFTEKKVLERTARHSILRSGPLLSERDSALSFHQPSRLSSSTQSSHGRTSISPTRSSFSSTAPSVPEKAGQGDLADDSGERIPRMSLSTEDGRSIDLHEDGEGVGIDSTPQLLPPIPFPSESFSESLQGITGSSRPKSRTLSIASKRMSYMTELRSKRDRSDTASLMTVDEITAEVESRRVSTALDLPTPGVDDWTKVDAEDDIEGEGTETLSDEEIDGGEEGTTLNDDVEPDDLRIAIPVRTANKWIKGALIGAGSFGKVYLGMDASNGLLMAVKQVELPTGSAPNQERKKSMLSALEREIELLKNLQHDNIVQYLYSSIDDEHLNIFLEYVPGGSVTALLRSYGAFEETLVRNFVGQILQGLDYLHERDIIHRDIKGANILVDNKGGIKISDFGISKKVDDNLLTGNRLHRPSLQGSVFWMAPEVVKQTGHTRKADIWSVGCLVVEMLTGEHPWAQLTQMQAIFKIGSSARPTIPSDISSDAQNFLQCSFEINHEARPSAAELLQHAWVVQKPAKGSASA